MEHLYEEILELRDDWQQGFISRAFIRLASLGTVKDFSGGFVRGRLEGNKFIDDPEGPHYRAAVLAIIDSQHH